MAFAIYSTDIAPTPDPANASPQPATLILFDQDPIFGDYDEQAGNCGRGTVIPTLGGVVVQDFGVVAGDERIRIADREALSEATVTALRNAHDTVDAEWFFTDGTSVRRVRFLRPDGLRVWRHLLWAAHGVEIYSYEITLIVIAKEI